MANNYKDSPSDLVELTGLWQNEGKGGGTYLKGTLGQAAMFIFPNKNKRPDSRDPDFKLYVSRRVKKQPETVSADF